MGNKKIKLKINLNNAHCGTFTPKLTYTCEWQNADTIRNKHQLSV